METYISTQGSRNGYIGSSVCNLLSLASKIVLIYKVTHLRSKPASDRNNHGSDWFGYGTASATAVVSEHSCCSAPEMRISSHVIASSHTSAGCVVCVCVCVIELKA